jgi:outer membrane protein assembly factor BamB
LHGNILVVVWDSEEESMVYAFDKRDGRQLWKQARDERTTWTTPFIKEHNGRVEAIINGSTAVRSYDLKTGELIWQCSGQTMNAVPMIVDKGDVVYAMSGFRGNAAMAIRLGRTGDLTDTDAVLWKLNRATPYVPSPLVYGDLLYMCKSNDSILTCVNAMTGEPYYQEERLEGVSGVYASPVGVNNRIYIAGRNGTTAVIEKSPTLKVLALNQLDESINASPAVVGDELYLRGSQHLYCISRNTK